MPTLSSSIVKQNLATMRDVEEALARQVLYGGDLATNLLELAAVGEAALTALLAESHALQAAPIGELPKATDAVLRVVPGDLALRHGFYPLAETAGALVVAVSEPLAEEVQQDLMFSLGTRLEQRAAPSVRILQALSRDYGLPMDRRTLRLVAKLEGRPDPSPSSLPAPMRGVTPLPALPRPASVPPLPYPTTLITPREGLSQPVERSSPPVELPRGPLVPATNQVRTLISPRQPLQPVAPSSRPLSSAVSVPPVPPSPPREAGRARGRKRHRGPYTAAMAEADLSEAEGRDDVLAAFFDFASQYFEYTALFVLHSDLAEGRDADGPGADSQRIRAIGVPLDLPSVLSTARETRTWQLTALADDGLDLSLAVDLERPRGKLVLVLPIVVRDRTVLVLYGDHGEQDVAMADIGDVLAFAPLVSAAFERLILRRKGVAVRELQTPIAPRPKPRLRQALPEAELRAEALARALDLSGGEAIPSTDDASPKARTPVSQNSPATVGESPIGRRSEAGRPPSTRAESPQARDVGRPTPREIPSRRVVRIGQRLSTPPQGTPSVEPDPQPFPLTRRTPKSEPPQDEQLPPDSGWDVSEAHPHTTPGLGNPSRPLTGRGRKDSGPHLEVTEAELDDDYEDFDPPQSDSATTLQLDTREVPLAPSSRKVSFGPRRPRPRHSSPNLRLPSVIVDLEADCIALVERLVAGDDSAGDQLVEVGEAAVLVLVARFPGPVRQETARRMGELGTKASDCGPVLRTVARMGEVAAQYLIVRTADGDPTIRRFATWLLGEVPGSDSARAIVRRAVDDDAEVRRAAIAAGRMLQSDVDSRTALRDGLATLASDPEQPEATRHAAIEALADLRDGRAVPRLIPLLSEQSGTIAKSAAWALSILARQEFGRDSKAWSAWWAAHSSQHRIEWLIEALMHDELDVRRSAGEELKVLTKEYFGYYEDLPAAERALAQKRYREWWGLKGKARFY